MAEHDKPAELSAADLEQIFERYKVPPQETKQVVQYPLGGRSFVLDPASFRIFLAAVKANYIANEARSENSVRYKYFGCWHLYEQMKCFDPSWMIIPTTFGRWSIREGKQAETDYLVLANEAHKHTVKDAATQRTKSLYAALLD